MDIIFYILCVAVVFFITYMLGLQFYKLGQNLKDKFPIVYRIYTIFWGFIGAFVLIGVLVGVKSKIDDYQHNKKIEKIELTFKKYASNVDYIDIISRARLLGYSDKEIYSDAKEGKKLKKVFDELAREGITDKEIGKFLNLDPYDDYVSEARKAANEAVIAANEADLALLQMLEQPNTKNNELTVEQMAQLAKQAEQPKNNTPKTQKYYTFDMFIAPDLQEKVGSDTYKLQGMIADAKNAQKQDRRIYEMLKETVQYGVIISEYEENGLSEKQIAEKFGLSL